MICTKEREAAFCSEPRFVVWLANFSFSGPCETVGGENPIVLQWNPAVSGSFTESLGALQSILRLLGLRV